MTFNVRMDKPATKNQILDLLSMYDPDMEELMYEVLDGVDGESVDDFVADKMIKKGYTFEEAGDLIGGDDFDEDCRISDLYLAMKKIGIISDDDEENFCSLYRDDLSELFEALDESNDDEEGIENKVLFFIDDDVAISKKELKAKIKELKEEVFRDYSGEFDD